jgi:hypothetical protein
MMVVVRNCAQQATRHAFWQARDRVESTEASDDTEAVVPYEERYMHAMISR